MQIWIATQIFTIATANICDKSTIWEPIEEVYNHWPGFVACTTKVRSDLLIYLVHVLLLHVSRLSCPLVCIVNFSFISFPVHQVSLAHRLTLVLTVTKFGPLTATQVFFNFTESE